MGRDHSKGRFAWISTSDVTMHNTCKEDKEKLKCLDMDLGGIDNMKDIIKMLKRFLDRINREFDEIDANIECKCRVMFTKDNNN